jgi:di/tricarboxylate transporter
MRVAAVILALILAVVAVVYLVVPADSLPGFFPGHDPGSHAIHVKHGIASGVAALVLFAIGWWVGRR